MNNDILLVDFSAICHQMWHVHGTDPDPAKTSTEIVAKVRALASGRTRGVGICLDSGRSFRHDIAPDYKANRSQENRAPLYHQMALAIETLKADGFPMFEAKGFEADDVIAAIATRAPGCEKPCDHVTIASADKDLLQLVDDAVSVHSTRTGATLTAAEVKAKFGVEPHQMVDFLTLVGDTSDNVKGCPGVGEKTAAKLLSDFGNLDDMYAAFDKGATPTVTPNLRTKLQDFRAQMPVTRSLIQLRTDAPIDIAPLFVDRVTADVATFGEDDRLPMSLDSALQFVDTVARFNRPDLEGSTMTMEEAEAEIDSIMKHADPPAPKVETVPLIPKGEQVNKPSPAKAEDASPAPAGPGCNHAGPVVAGNGATSKSEPMALAVRDAEVVDCEYERQLEPRSMNQAISLSKYMFESRLFSAYGTPQAVLSTVMAGRELGLPALAALRSFHVIDGKPVLAADALRALVLKSGKAETFRCTERSATRATFTTTRKGDDGPTTLTYTIEEARQAWPKDKIAWDKSGWGKNPADLLVARAGAKLARLVYPDVCAALYAMEEF